LSPATSRALLAFPWESAEEAMAPRRGSDKVSADLARES
jgi:hypothetical protein